MSRPPDVEFVVPEHPDGADEELPTPARGPHGWGVRIAIAVAVLVVGVVAVRGATDRSGTPTGRAVATTTVHPPTPSPSAAATAGLADRGSFEPLIPRLLAAAPCRAEPGCRSTRTLPVAFRAAVRAQFPGTTTVVSASRVLPRDRLWSREYTGRFGVTVLHVVVSPGAIRGPTTTFDDGIWVRAASWCRSGSDAVQVFASAPSGHDPPLAKLTRLCTDPRLLAAG